MSNLTDDDEISIHLERDPLIGQTLGNYGVVSVIGRGGMGVVYKGRHKVIDRPVAIKTLHLGRADDPGEALRRFHREAKAVSHVEHPNTVRLFDFGVTPEGCPFLIMELLDGVCLRQVLKEASPLPLARANAIFQQVVSALKCAHEAGIVHKDLKPENIMLSEKAGYGSDWVHVLDFGISAMANKDGVVNGNGNNENSEIVGSPPYMSPEQCARAQAIDARSDIYSLGICLFEALSGTFPYKTRSAMEIIEGHLTGKPKLLRDVSMHTSTYESVTQVIQKALEKNPAKRHQTVKEFGEELEDAVNKDSKRGMALKDRVSMEIPRSTEFVDVNKEVFDELDTDEDLITTGARRIYVQKKKSIGNQLKQMLYGDSSADKIIQKSDDEKIVFFQCPHCGTQTQPELSLCLCCGRSLAAKDDFSKLRAARGDFSLPKQHHQTHSRETKAARPTKAAMVNTGRAWTRSMGLVFLSILLIACVFIASGGYHLLMGALSNKPQPTQPE